MNALETIISNLINGNLTTAKQQAKRHSARKIREYLIGQGYSLKHAVAAADFLKGEATFQEYCDAELEGKR